MAEYILKSMAYYMLKQEAETHNLPASKEAYERAADIVSQLKERDVRQVIHGHWEEISGYGGWGDTYYRCSVCGEEWHLEDGTPQQNNMNFCPRCGADMSGGKT